MGNISLGFIVCILASLCLPIRSTPVDTGPAGPISPTPQVEPRDVVTVWKHQVNSAVQKNPPWYNTACKVGGCTFSYEARHDPMNLTAHLTTVVGLSVLLAHDGTLHGMPLHTSCPSDRNASPGTLDVCHHPIPHSKKANQLTLPTAGNPNPST